MCRFSAHRPYFSLLLLPSQRMLLSCADFLHTSLARCARALSRTPVGTTPLQADDGGGPPCGVPPETTLIVLASDAAAGAEAGARERGLPAAAREPTRHSSARLEADPI